MNRDYIVINNKVLVSDENGMTERENTSNIEMQLKLENSIEILQSLISEKEKELNVPKEQSSNKILFTIILAALACLSSFVLFPALDIWLSSNMSFADAILNSFVEKSKRVTADRVYALLMSIIMTGVTFSIYFKARRRVNQIEQELSYLHEELDKTQTELDKVKLSSLEIQATETASIESLQDYNKEFEATATNRLNKIRTLTTLRRQLVKLYGTEELDQKLRSLDFTEEEIPMGKEVIKSFTLQSKNQNK